MVKEKGSKYNYAIMVIGGTLLALGFAGLFIVRPLANTVIKMNETKKEKDATLTEMEQREEVLLGLADQEEQLKKNSQTISNALPTKEDIGRLFIQLDTMATESGGSLKSISQSNSQKADASTFAGVSEQTYVIPVEMPTYFALKQFITNSGDALRLLSISDIKVDANEAGRLSVNLTAKSYARTE